MKYAVVINNAIVETRDYPEAIPADKIKHVGGVPQLRPVVFVPAAGYNQRKHNKLVVTTISDTQVTETETLVDIPLAQVKANELIRIRAEARATIYAKYPIERQLSAILGVYPAAYKAQLAADVAAVVAESNAAEAQITNTVATADDAIAVTATWPTI